MKGFFVTRLSLVLLIVGTCSQLLANSMVITAQVNTSQTLSKSAEVFQMFGDEKEFFFTRKSIRDLLRPDSTAGKWSFTAQTGWATNIDFSINSTSKDYRFNGSNTGVNATFKSYDSRENIKKFGGDQANNYLLTVKHEIIGVTITGGIIHDKREQTPNTNGNRFRYDRGGTAPTLMLGYQRNFMSTMRCDFGAQLKAGGFVNFNQINVDLTNSTMTTTYYAKSNRRTYAGGGFIGMAIVSCNYLINDSWSVSLLVNGTFMAGNAYAMVDAMHHLTRSVNKGKLSVNYTSISIGPSLGITFRR